MARKGLVGMVRCPFHHVCGNEQAEVRLDKHNHLYIVCYECEPVSQHFTRGAAQRIKALGLEAFVEPKPAPPAPSPKPASGDPPKPEPAKKRGVFDDLKL